MAENWHSRRKRTETINVKDDADLHFWTRELGVDERTLTQIVRRVGPSLPRVRDEISGTSSGDKGGQS